VRKTSEGIGRFGFQRQFSEAEIYWDNPPGTKTLSLGILDVEKEGAETRSEDGKKRDRWVGRQMLQALQAKRLEDGEEMVEGKATGRPFAEHG